MDPPVQAETWFEKGSVLVVMIMASLWPWTTGWNP